MATTSFSSLPKPILESMVLELVQKCSLVTSDLFGGSVDLVPSTLLEDGKIVERYDDCEVSNEGIINPLISLDPLVNGVHLMEPILSLLM